MSPEEEPSPTISEPPVSEDSEPSTEPEVVLDTDDLIEPDENLPPQEEVVSDDVPVSSLPGGSQVRRRLKLLTSRQNQMRRWIMLATA
ncbi:MAG: hypothetical protein GDA43_25990 [Hormoscilla sp. SP5CHS1]|nr:hypothetical protein [Hormoscilla sp. SP5CHS1]